MFSAGAHFRQSLSSEIWIQDATTVAVVGRGTVVGRTLDLAARQDKNPRFTSKESFESDETEEEPLRAPPGLGGVMRDGLMAYLRIGCRCPCLKI